MGSRLEVLWLDKDANVIPNLKLENADDFPFSLSDIVEKNLNLLTLMCGMLPEKWCVFSGTPDEFVLKTAIKTEHTYRLDSELKLVLISQRKFPCTLEDLRGSDL